MSQTLRQTDNSLIPLEVDYPIWDRFLSVAPLVVIGTTDADGKANLAPKHMVTPLGWGNHFAFVCSQAHSTYQNVERSGEFTVSYPRPDQVVMAALTAAPRCEDGSQPMLPELPTVPSQRVSGVFLRDSYLFLECQLERLIDGFEDNNLVVGEIVGALVHRDALLRRDRDPQDALAAVPLLAYLNPGRFAEIDESNSFPYPDGFRR